MQLLFIILAHNQPADVAELAKTLTQASAKANVIIHFDANALESDYVALEKAINSNFRISLVKNRVACSWGDFSLVESVLNAIRQEISQGKEYDYAMLLSGSCLPCRPIKQLEHFLAKNYGKEFIETYDENWMIGGLRKERYQFYYPFPPKPDADLRMHYWTKFQKLLNIKRRPPHKLEIRFGSQWWTLTWETCKKIIETLEKVPRIEVFFKKTYIPDEMMINSLVWSLVPHKNIVKHSLTYFKFTSWGKPIVFYDDHGDYPFMLNKFFYRKVANEARALRQASLKLALTEDDAHVIPNINHSNNDYELKIKLQCDLPVPGQIYYRDQFADMGDRLLRTAQGEYVFVCGTRAVVKDILSNILDPRFFVLGHIFENSCIDLGENLSDLDGLESSDFKIRDLHPMLYLVRLRNRVSGIPVFGWSPDDNKVPMDIVAWDSKALVILITPHADNSEQARDLLDISTQKEQIKNQIDMVQRQRLSVVPGISQKKLDYIIMTNQQDQQDQEIHVRKDAIPERMTNAFDRNIADNTVVYPIPDAPDVIKRSQEIMEYSITNCIHRETEWFAVLHSIIVNMLYKS